MLLGKRWSDQRCSNLSLEQWQQFSTAHDDTGGREALGEQFTTDETMFAHYETLGRFLSLKRHSSVTYR
jgi:hypothetical protein